MICYLFFPFASKYYFNFNTSLLLTFSTKRKTVSNLQRFLSLKLNIDCLNIDQPLRTLCVQVLGRNEHLTLA